MYGDHFLFNIQQDKINKKEDFITNPCNSKKMKQKRERKIKKPDYPAQNKIKKVLKRKEIKDLFPEIIINDKACARKPQITKQSDKIVKGKGLAKVNVFERLQHAKKEKANIDEIIQSESLHDGMIKKNHKNTKSMAELNLNLKDNKSKENYCSRNIILYNKGMVTLKQREKKISKMKKEKEFKELSQASFCPHININSEYYIRSSQRLENELLNIHKSLEMKRKRKVNEVEKSEPEFHPKILAKSITIDSSKSKTRPLSQKRFEKLYINAEKLSQKLENKRNNLTLGSFKPYMFPYNKHILESPTIQPRIQRSKSETKKHLKKDEEKAIEKYTFIPKICRGPKTNQNKENSLIVEERLTLYGKERDKKLKRRIMNEDLNAKALVHSNFIDSNSLKLMEMKKNDKLIEIFNYIDSDQDGAISSTNSEISHLSENVRKLIAPLIKKMEETNATYQKDEFMYEISLLYECLPIVEKNALLFNPMNDCLLIFQNQPLQRSNSEMKISLGKDLSNNYNSKLKQNLFKNKVQIIQKLHNIKEEEDKKIYQDCTFHPKINSIKIPRNTLDNEYIFEDYNKIE